MCSKVYYQKDTVICTQLHYKTVVIKLLSIDINEFPMLYKTFCLQLLIQLIVLIIIQFHKIRAVFISSDGHHRLDCLSTTTISDCSTEIFDIMN